jgi:hypothetical protein
MFEPIGSKATVCAFTLTPNVIITGHESGKVRARFCPVSSRYANADTDTAHPQMALFDVKKGEEIQNNERAHSKTVTDLQLSKDRTYCITSALDQSARVSGVCLFVFVLFFFFCFFFGLVWPLFVSHYRVHTHLRTGYLFHSLCYVFLSLMVAVISLSLIPMPCADT